MSYLKSGAVAASEGPLLTISHTCFCCGETAEGPAIGYDVRRPDGRYVRVLFHRDCAFVMAQRIICDAWPNRRDGEWMSIDR